MQHYKTGKRYRAVDVGTFCKLVRVLTAFWGPTYACTVPPGMRLVNQLVYDFCEPFN
jgi:hypothetical protein